MEIAGLQKLTLLDFPGKTACTLFTPGCNFRCPYCHNAELVWDTEGERIPEDEIFAFLDKRKGLLDGVCITGGEPTMQKDLYSFIVKIKKEGFLVKLDTNGSHPQILQQLIKDNLLDYVAMDIKNSKENYPLAAGVPVNLEKLQQSIDLLMDSGIDYEFRCTVVKELHTAKDFESMGSWLKGAKRFSLQTFVDSGHLIKSGFSPYSETEMQNLQNIMQKYIPDTIIK